LLVGHGSAFPARAADAVGVLDVNGQLLDRQAEDVAEVAPVVG